MQVGEYDVKIALNEKGYHENLKEKELSPKLQPYVTKVYDSNGYILISEHVDMITPESLESHNDILKMFHSLYQENNFNIDENFGFKDSKLVLLDFE